MTDAPVFVSPAPADDSIPQPCSDLNNAPSDENINDTPLPSFSFVDLLDVDPRPTLVLSLATPVPRVVYSNPAFASTGLSPSQDSLWADLDVSTPAPAPVSTAGFFWTRSILRNGLYAIISANQTAPESPTPAATATAPEDIPLPLSPNVQRPPLPLISTLMPPAPSTVVSTTLEAPPIAADRVVPSLHPLQQQHTEPPTPPASAVFLPTPQAEPTKNDSPPVVAATHTPDATPGATPEEVSAQNESFFPAHNPDEPPADSDKYLDQFEAITDFMPVGMCVVDAAGNIASANIAWHHIMGCAFPPTENGNGTLPDGLVMTRQQFLSYVEDEDQELVQSFFANSTHAPTSTFGFRVKKYRLKGAKSQTPKESGASTTTSTDRKSVV